MTTRPTLRRSAGLLAVLVAAGVGAPASEAAKLTFGATLDAITYESLGTQTCSSGTWYYQATGNILGPASTGSCQFTGIGIFGNTTFGQNAPATGTATAARVKVGPITGPMRINVVRVFFQQTGNAASPTPSVPFMQAYGPTFTPTANAVTTVPLNLPMLAQATPGINDTGTVAATDYLALEVLAPNVPVPVVPYANASFFAAFPGPSAGPVPAPSSGPLPNYGQIGLALAMSADLETTTTTGGGGGAGGGGTTPPGGGAGTTPPAAGAQAVTLGRPTAKVSAGRAALELVCQGADCKGQVTLQRVAASGKTTSLGKARFSGKAGASTRVRVTLNSRGKALLKGKRKATVQAAVAIEGSAPVTLPVTLRR